MVDKEKSLVMFSGGKDSFLTACRLIEDGKKVYLVTFDNGCTLGSERVVDAANRIIKRYGEEKVEFLGIYSHVGIWRTFFLPVFNMKPSEIISNYGEITISQLNCLLCRSAMYLYSIALCKSLEISTLAEGARRNQKFVIQLKEMTDCYEKLLAKFNIELLLPVIDITNDFYLQNELLMSGFVPSTSESQCLLGVPIDSKRPIDQDIIAAVVNFYNKEILPKSEDIINENMKSIAYHLKNRNGSKYH